MGHFNRALLGHFSVAAKFGWDSFINGGRVDAVLNEYGGRDIWPKVAEWCIHDGGASGARGFQTAHPSVFQRRRPLFGHSDYFYPLNYRDNWIPFLRGAEPSECPVQRTGRLNWRFLSLTLFILAAVLVGAYFVLKNR